MKNFKSLKISLAKNRDLFYYLDFNLKDAPIITNKNILQFIALPVELSYAESELSLIYSNIKTSPCSLIRVQYKSY